MIIDRFYYDYDCNIQFYVALDDSYRISFNKS